VGKGDTGGRACWGNLTLLPQPYTLNPKPYNLIPIPYTLHPKPQTKRRSSGRSMRRRTSARPPAPDAAQTCN